MKKFFFLILLMPLLYVGHAQAANASSVIARGDYGRGDDFHNSFGGWQNYRGDDKALDNRALDNRALDDRALNDYRSASNPTGEYPPPAYPDQPGQGEWPPNPNYNPW